MDDEYTIPEAVEIIKKAVDRKNAEIEELEKKAKRLKKEESIAEVQALIDYLRADVVAYMTVIADMTEDDSVLEGVEVDPDKVVECPEKYDEYLNGLSADDLENELDADEIRADYCDSVLELISIGIGEEALSSKKFIKHLLDDEYILSIIGEAIIDDDELYKKFRELVEDDGAGDEKKPKKKGKKKSKK